MSVVLVPFYLVPFALVVGFAVGLAGYTTARRAAYRDYLAAHQRHRWESTRELVEALKGEGAP